MEKELERLSSRIARILIVVCALFAVGNLKAQEYPIVATPNGDGVEYTLYEDMTAVLTNGKNCAVSKLLLEYYVRHEDKPYKLIRIEDYAFVNTKKITTISLPSSIESIGKSAFKNCAFTSINLPPYLQTIGTGVFEGCSNLKTIKCQGYNPPTLVGEGTLTGSDENSTIQVYVPEDCLEAYKTLTTAFSEFTKIKEVSDESLDMVDRIDFKLDKEELIFTPGEIKDLIITLAGAELFYSLQFDLFLPKGMSIEQNQNGDYNATISSSKHDISVNLVKNGSYRFVISSPSNQKFGGDQTITLKIKANDNYEGGEIKFADGIGTKFNNVIDALDGMPSRDKIYEVGIPEVPITSIELNHNQHTLRVGESTTLVVSYSPVEATGKSVTWTSSEPTVATVSSTGEVLALALGTTIITAATKNNITAQCTITVEPTPASTVTISTPQKSTLIIGEKITLTASVLPETTTDKTVVWSTSNSSIATVDEKGEVTAVGSGNVTITAKCGEVSGTVSLKVESIITSLSLSPTELTLEKGRKENLSAVYLPNKPDKIHLNWTTSDPSIATVNGSGEVSGIKPGNVTITVTDSESNLTAECKVVIIDTLFGDADNNGSITINDAIIIINHILERTPEDFDAGRIDVDGNGIINVVDVSMTIDLALKASEGSIQRAQALMNTRTPNEAVKLGVTEIDHNDVAVIPVSLETEDMYTALQADFVLPTELEVEDIILDNSLNKTHTVQFIKLENGAIRMILFSSSLQPLSTGNNLLNIHVRKMDDGFTGGEIVMKNAIASMEDGSGMAVSDVKAEISVLSALEDLTVDDTLISVNGKSIIVKTDVGNNVNIFNLAGNKIASYQSAGTRVTEVQGGIYIVIVKGKSYKIWVP